MIFTKKQLDEMLEAALPLMVWMDANCHPHCTAHVDGQSVELVEGVGRNIRREVPHETT